MNSHNTSVHFAAPTPRKTDRPTKVYPVLKRVTDVVLALLMLAFTGPLILVAGGLVRILSSGPAFICVTRVGLGGRTILIHKIRTMYMDADRLLEEHLRADPEAARQWSTQFKLKNDPRIIPYVGGFLRKSSIDELPQFLDVLAGRMSLVGPRPFPAYHLRAFDPSFCEARSGVTPGITGLWQIECRNGGDLRDQVYWDTQYLENRSFLLDLLILIRTPIIVFTGRSAY